jgi:hypothetical protein
MRPSVGRIPVLCAFRAYARHPLSGNARCGRGIQGLILRFRPNLVLFVPSATLRQVERWPLVMIEGRE